MIPISALILAGGQATRMQGRDKGLVVWRGMPLIEHVLARVQPQVDDVVISCNRNAELYGRYGRCLPDVVEGFAGPLAGMAACLPLCVHEWVLVVACDMPCLPVSLAGRLMAGLGDNRLAVAHDGVHLQPLALLMHRELGVSLEGALREGVFSVQRWINGHSHSVVYFEDEGGFINVNRLGELE